METNQSTATANPSTGVTKKVTLKDSSLASPSLVYIPKNNSPYNQDTLLLVWQGDMATISGHQINEKNNIMVMPFSTNLTPLTPDGNPILLIGPGNQPYKCIDTPSAFFAGPGIFITYTGLDNLMYSILVPPSFLVNPPIPDGPTPFPSNYKTYATPAYVFDTLNPASKSLQYVAWTGENEALYMGKFVPYAPSWSQPQLVEHNKVVAKSAKGNGPGLAVFNLISPETIIIGWTGTDDSLNVATTTDGIHFSAFSKVMALVGGKLVSQTSAMGPFLTSFEDSVYIAWADTGKHLKVLEINQNGQQDGNLFTDTTNTAAFGPPAVAFLPNSQYIAWTGTGPDHTLNIASFNI